MLLLLLQPCAQSSSQHLAPEPLSRGVQSGAWHTTAALHLSSDAYQHNTLKQTVHITVDAKKGSLTSQPGSNLSASTAKAAPYKALAHNITTSTTTLYRPVALLCFSESEVQQCMQPAKIQTKLPSKSATECQSIQTS